MENTAKIGAGQLFCLLYISRMLTTVTFSPVLSDGLFNGSFLLNILFACLFTLILCVPCFIFYRRFPSQTPLTVAPKKIKPFLTAFYSLFFIFCAAVSVSRFYIFLTSVIYSEKDMRLFLILAVLLCSYSAYLGIEAMARGNVILLIITVIGMSAIFFTVADKISIYNLEPVFFHPVSQSVKSGLFACSRTVETAAFLFLYSKTKGRIKRGFLISFLLFAISLVLLFFFLGGVSGEFAKTQLFPFYSLAVIARFPFFERLDSVITAIWIFSILIKCSLFIFISGEQLESFSFMNKKRSLIFCFVSVCVLSLLFSCNLTIHKTVSSPYIFMFLTVFLTVIIPFFELVSNRKGRA